MAIQNVDTRCMTSQAGERGGVHNPACIDERNGVCGQLFSGGVRCIAYSYRKGRACHGTPPSGAPFDPLKWAGLPAVSLMRRFLPNCR